MDEADRILNMDFETEVSCFKLFGDLLLKQFTQLIYFDSNYFCSLML